MSFAKVSAGAKVAVTRAVVVALCGVMLTACDTLSSLNPFDKSETYKPEIVPEVPADQLYNDGLARIQKEDYAGAAKKFSDLEKQSPYSEWSRKALIMEAYANYEGGLYEEAITASRRYLQLHPATQDAAYAQYLLAMSHYNQIPDITRDQEKSERALVALQELVDRYPTSEYVTDAKQKLQVARDQLAGKEMEIGRFYLQKRNYTGRDQPLPQRRRQLPDDPPRRRGAAAPDRGLHGHGHRQRGADGGGRARAQLPGQPLVQGRLRPPDEGWRRALREFRILDQQGLPRRSARRPEDGVSL